MLFDFFIVFSVHRSALFCWFSFHLIRDTCICSIFVTSTSFGVSRKSFYFSLKWGMIGMQRRSDVYKRHTFIRQRFDIYTANGQRFIWFSVSLAFCVEYSYIPVIGNGSFSYRFIFFENVKTANWMAVNIGSTIN